MASALDPPEYFATTKQQTYGRKAAHLARPDKGAPTNLLFDDHLQSDGDATSSPVLGSDAKWRQRLADMDISSDDDMTEDSVEVMRAQLRKQSERENVNEASIPLTSTTSSTSSLSTAPVSASSGPGTTIKTPLRASKSPDQSLDGAVHSLDRSDASEHALGVPEPVRQPQHSPSSPESGNGIAPSPTRKSGGPKSLSKAEQQQMRKDIAQAERERPLQLSRPRQSFRPVSAWLKNATVAVEPSSSPGAGQGSDDIQQFTPSSAAKNDGTPGHSGCIVPASSSPTKSSPTRRSKQLPGSRRFPKFATSEDGREVTLDSILTTASKRGALDERKKKALEKQTSASTRAIPDDDADSLDVVAVPTSRPSDNNDVHPVPDARAVLNRTTAVPAPSRQKQQLLRWSGKPKSKNIVSETHVDFAAHKFGHAELKRINGGSRPAGQKKGRDEVIQQAQVDYNLLRRHQDQISALAKRKEAQYGGVRHLPPKQRLAIPELGSASPDEGSSDSDSDDDYIERAATGSASNGDSEIGTEEEEGDTTITTVQGQQSVPHVTANTEAESTPKQRNGFNDEDVDGSPILRRPKRPVRRVNIESDNESSPVSNPSNRDHTVPLDPDQDHHCSPSLDLAGFDSREGFSQLFGQTQHHGQQPSGGDAFADMRQNDHGLLPQEALLPSVNVSESQAIRDRALIAGEADAGDLSAVTEDEQVYLNSQGFFTQTRPVGRSTPDAEVADMAGTAPGGSDPAPSSTVLNSSTQHEISPASPSLTRLRRRLSGESATVQEARPQEDDNRPRRRSEGLNAFDRLGRKPQPDSMKQRPRFVDEQAEESDDEDGWFLARKDNENEEDDDPADDDGYVKELVDDSALSAEERRQLALQAAEKHREIAREDDARLEAEAKKVTEGFYRTKRRGNDFMSDEEDDEGRPRKLSKKQRRQRRLDREDGLYKIGGEENKFLEMYEADLDSEVDFEETPQSPSAQLSPMEQPLSALERTEMLRNRGQANRMVGATLFPEDEDDEPTTSDFAISHRKGVTVVSGPSQDGVAGRVPSAAARSMESYSRFLADETSNPRRTGVGVSVVQRRSETTSSNSTRSVARAGSAPNAQGPKRDSRRLGTSNSVLMEKSDRFGG